VATTPETGKTEWDAQIDVFETQMRLAAKLKRVVSLHCVQAQGMMLDVMRKLAGENELPPRICMHSFGGSYCRVCMLVLTANMEGSIEMARAYLALKGVGDRFYFSFSATINSRSPKTALVIAGIPLDKLLVESDDEVDLEGRMNASIDLAAKARQCTTDQIAATTFENAQRFFMKG
jgi:Tat protein secretion system quality control protein TatD with DNase activity